MATTIKFERTSLLTRMLTEPTNYYVRLMLNNRLVNTNKEKQENTIEFKKVLINVILLIKSSFENWNFVSVQRKFSFY